MIAELKQRLAIARDDFNQLSKIWNHTSVLPRTKRAIFQQCIVSKLLYGLEGVWLTKIERKNLDSFYIRCLRRLYKISHSMISRVSNQYILDLHGTIPLSSVLLRRQLLMFGKIARLPAESAIRQLIFEDGTCIPKVLTNRKRGRPRQEWAVELQKIIEKMEPIAADREIYLMNRETWITKFW